MFKAVEAKAAYPVTGLTPALWREILPRHVPIGELIATQSHLAIAGLAPDARVAHDADRLVHVVQWQGHLFVEDGHHRIVRERLAGADWVNARVYNLDHHGPVPAEADRFAHLRGTVVVDVVPDVLEPGLVWVHGKGFRSPHIARALDAAAHGGRVDWSRWTEGTPAELKPLQYRDAG